MAITAIDNLEHIWHMIENHDAVRTSPHPTFYPLMVGQGSTLRLLRYLSKGRGALIFCVYPLPDILFHLITHKVA
jgi:hypothetical protein